MKTLIRAFMLISVVLVAPVRAQDAFVLGLPDVPVMVGLAEDTDARLEFDKEQGRIVEVVLRGTHSPQAILDYYREALPELGWVLDLSKADRLSLHRGDETLQLHADRHGRVGIVTISLSPK